ncbi:MAG: hypothetical protein ACSW8G_03755 [Bacillota bacterium]
MKKILLLLISVIFVLGCVGLTACSGSDEEAQSEDVQEETAAETLFYGGFGYMGDDPIVGAAYEYAATELPKGYDVEEGMISIPVVDIVDTVKNDDGTVDVAGVFEIYNYKVDGTTLMTESGGSHPGKIHMVPDGDYYKAESFEAVADGSEFDESAKAIFGDSYDAFIKVYSDDEALAKLRTESIQNYVQATGMDITQYQDYGWDPVEL